ncbi:ATP/GTP-binding protein [Streptomyces sp. NPDC093252]|uniref:ATP/GTP-binding protein n=1 Tax=Streptomyces sp. NPDC093252 TaxID=3154980 RepID=UPI003438F624
MPPPGPGVPPDAYGVPGPGVAPDPYGPPGPGVPPDAYGPPGPEDLPDAYGPGPEVPPSSHGPGPGFPSGTHGGPGPGGPGSASSPDAPHPGPGIPPVAHRPAPGPGIPPDPYGSPVPGIPPTPPHPIPQIPPRPQAAPHGTPPHPGTPPGRTPVAEWLDTPRPAVRPGVWRFGYRPPQEDAGTERLAPITVVGLLIPFVVGLLLWSLWRQGGIPYQFAPLRLVTPDDWWWGGTLASPQGMEGAEARVVYDGVFFAALVVAMGRLGSWSEVVRYSLGRRPQPARALLALLAALIALSLVFPDAFPGVGWNPLPVVAPLFSLTVLISGGYDLFTSQLFVDSVYGLITLLVVLPFARVGGWLPYARALLDARRAGRTRPAAGPAEPPRSQWPALREAGRHQAADLLTAEVLTGRMNDVDCARVDRAWRDARHDGARLAAFTDTVLRQGAAAWVHPSGARDLPTRTAVHDPLAGQVRIGRWTTGDRVPAAHRGAGAALGPAVLATSLLAIGPSGAGKTRRLIAPVVESLALTALTGGASVVAVTATGTPLGPDSAYDVVVRLGDPASVHDLDPYAEADDPDEAAAILAEALIGDVEQVGHQSAHTALAQLLGPYRAVHGRFPPLPVLRALLEGDPGALTALRDALTGERHTVMRRELEARLRQHGTAADTGPALADRLALLDRPAFADFFTGSAAPSAPRPFSLRAVAHHPLRVRIDLPAHGHEEASRLLTRLILAQFTAVVRDAGRRPHFAALVLDDATGTITAESLRRVQRLRSQNAGAVLALRTVGDVPEALHGPLFAAVGCRMAFSGVTTWDGGRFAQAWGTEWVETREVAQHTVFADQPMTRAIHALRKLVTGKAVTTDAVTVRQVERERWSASQLAHDLPPGHAVLSLTDTHGDHTPPTLLELSS